MRWKAVCVLSHTILLAVPARAGSTVTTQASGHMDQSRRRQASRALRSRKWLVRRRAIQELAQHLRCTPAIESILLQEFYAPNSDAGDTRFDVAKALTKGGSHTVSKLVAEFPKRQRSDETLLLALVTIGLVGAEAKGAIPFMLRQLKIRGRDPQIRGSIRVVLANMGYRAPTNRKLILSGISGRTKAGRAAVHMLTLIGPGDWVGRDMVRELIKWLDTPSRESEIASVTLGLSRARAQLAGKHLRGLFKMVQRDEELSSYQIIYGVSLARIDENRRKTVLRDVLRYVGSDDARGHTDSSAMSVVGNLIDPRMIAAIVKLLDDRDPQVTRGAARFLFTVGLPSEQSTCTLLRIARDGKSDESRALAARALGTVAHYSVIPELERIAVRDKSRDVREEVQRSLSILRLGGPK